MPWTNPDPTTKLVLPTGATTGQRIEISGDSITAYDINNVETVRLAGYLTFPSLISPSRGSSYISATIRDFGTSQKEGLLIEAPQSASGSITNVILWNDNTVSLENNNIVECLNVPSTYYARTVWVGYDEGLQSQTQLIDYVWSGQYAANSGGGLVIPLPSPAPFGIYSVSLTVSDGQYSVIPYAAISSLSSIGCTVRTLTGAAVPAGTLVTVHARALAN